MILNISGGDWIFNIDCFNERLSLLCDRKVLYSWYLSNPNVDEIYFSANIWDSGPKTLCIADPDTIKSFRAKDFRKQELLREKKYEIIPNLHSIKL